MNKTVFLFTPPFTQLNTPYPATAYLKGFLNTKKISSCQADLGIEIILSLFSREGLKKMFERIENSSRLPSQSESSKTSLPVALSANAERMMTLKEDYIQIIDDVILFLQGKNPTLAHLICKRNFLPESSRFAQTEDLHWAFGSMGIIDNAKHLATLFLEDIADLIKECEDPHFGFSRYAERLGRSAGDFDTLYENLQQPYTYIDELVIELLKKYIHQVQPKLVAVSVPFPGNLYSAFRCGQWIKINYPNIKIAMGGGFPNTELRSVADPRVFDFLDFITLDDGEAPIEILVQHIEGKKNRDELKRTFTLIENEVCYINNKSFPDYRQNDLGTPDYSDLFLDKYISAIEVVNPMHRMWSDGRWNKLTMAHGCYWGKCTFCDISLDYIKIYEPLTAALLCDRMEEIIKQTGQNGFHFVDEAAPPALMRALALEIIKRKMTVSWWTNIRFEKSFTRDLCLLLKASGCIAVSGGLEVASDRLLALIEKGITVAQVARVNQHFNEAGIMVHAYLMYGFPTQTAQETIDSLEMVRQMFKTGILQSAFWHLFTMTAHSPVGLHPEKYNVQKVSEATGRFANNDIAHIDLSGADHESFGFGLAKSLLNYMQGAHLDDPLYKWFDFKVPKTSIDPAYISQALNEADIAPLKPSSKIVWLGRHAGTEYFTQSKKGNTREMATLSFANKKDNQQLKLNKQQGDWLTSMLPKLSVNNNKMYTVQEVKENYEAAGLEDFELFWDNKPMTTLYRSGLLRL